MKSKPNKAKRPVFRGIADEAEGCSSGCAGQAGGFPLKSALGTSATEELFLDVMRCLCDVYSTGGAMGWEVAIRRAERVLGVDIGPMLVSRATSLLRALHAERRNSYRYLSFGCQHICDDEIALVMFLRALRKNNTMEAEIGLAAVTGGAPIAPQSHDAAMCLVGMFDLIERNKVRSASKKSVSYVNVQSANDVLH